MIKRFYIAFIAILLTMPAYAHKDDAYAHSASDRFTQKTEWMSALNDDLMLTELALPGTHDSSAYGSFTDITKTQVLSFSEQLKYGIRVFDIRIRHTSDRFALHHGSVYLKKMFGDFLSDVNTFLIQHPTEVVLFRLKEEQAPDNNNTRSLAETLDYYLNLYPRTYLKTTNKTITLKEARGKFIILSDLVGINNNGIKYKNSIIQDRYNLITNWDLYDKWIAVKNHLNTAIIGSRTDFYINYLSGSGGSFPYFVASGHTYSSTSAPRLATGKTTPGWKNSYPDFPRVDCFIGICTIAFEGINILTKNHITLLNLMSNVSGVVGSGIKSLRTVGIIMADFPGELLIQSVINNNKFK